MPSGVAINDARPTCSTVPMMALTATATDRVRADIVKLLKLCEPRCYVASFNRPNLTYRVVPKSSAYDQLLTFVRARPNDSGIVYCASRKATDSLAARLDHAFVFVEADGARRDRELAGEFGDAIDALRVARCWTLGR